MSKKIVTTKTFKEVPMPWWTSEVDVYELIYSLIKMTKAKNVMEIGVFEGYTSVKMVEALPKDGKFTGIDINDYLKNDLTSIGPEIDFILGESIKVMQGMKPKQFDFIFVDGDHSYENIVPEFKEVAKLITQGGIIVYHDTIGIPDVKRLMEHISKLGYNVLTFKTSDNRGLSLVQKL
jgi:predicted O-methyltransferase YrrM